MDLAEILALGARDLTIAKHLLASGVALTLYDYLLAFDDEIRYVWGVRKTWVSYLYILNRILLTGYQLLAIYYTSSPGKSKTLCLVGYYIQVFLITFFLFSSDVFITLRVYAISSGNRVLVIYFVTLLLARMAISLVLAFAVPPGFRDLQSIPIDAFNLCGIIRDLKCMAVPYLIGTVFDLSAFLVIVQYTYRNKGALKFSALARTVVAEATIYFLAMIAVQVYIQLSLNVMEGTSQQLSVLAYGILNPILTMRFAISLKRSADPNGGREWQLTHSSSVNFASGPLLDTWVSGIHENIEMDPIDPPNGRP